MTLNEQRLEILRKVERGELSTEDGSRLLEELEMGLPLSVGRPRPPCRSPRRAPSRLSQMSKSSRLPRRRSRTRRPQLTDLEASRFNFWQKWWLLPFGIGVVLTLLGAYWMYLGFMSAGLGWGFWLSWVPFGLGVVITAAAARSRTARWLHVRVHQDGEDDSPHNVNISFPLPISFGAWVLRTFGHWMPENFQSQHLDEVLAVLDKALTKDAPLHVMVNEDDGDQVEVFIG